MSDLNMSQTIHVSVPPDTLYEMVSDVTRMGEWSPVCRECWWDEGAGPHVGAWFTGRNVTPERTWETRSQVVAAEPGRRFAWEVNNGWVSWCFTFAPDGEGALLTESWIFLPAGIAGFHQRFGADADAEIEKRRQAAEDGIPATLAAIKKAAETG
ncbi:SRPBCC family protein [Mycobacterium neglectum]|jgi:hypothetical protein|uniref:SRPBCC family protein n=1 Tax=Mycobacterium neglectum TaxID=242737 RepID=UPI000BFF057A|nr:SRPBCC family protein [Mycobacterium neglectum]